jgi:hypothetical protein
MLPFVLAGRASMHRIQLLSHACAALVVRDKPPREEKLCTNEALRPCVVRALQDSMIFTVVRDPPFGQNG